MLQCIFNIPYCAFIFYRITRNELYETVIHLKNMCSRGKRNSIVIFWKRPANSVSSRPRYININCISRNRDSKYHERTLSILFIHRATTCSSDTKLASTSSSLSLLLPCLWCASSRHPSNISTRIYNFFPP